MPNYTTSLGRRQNSEKVTVASATRAPHHSEEKSNTFAPPDDPDIGSPGVANWSAAGDASPPYLVALPKMDSGHPRINYSKHLILNKFGFDKAPTSNEIGNAIDDDRVITGIRVDFMYRPGEFGGGQIKTAIVQLTEDSIVRRGFIVYDDFNTWPETGPDEWSDFRWGQNGYMWEVDWSASKIRDEKFGVVIQVRNSKTLVDVTAEITDVRITVWHKAP